jgi:hypothetical protein
VAEQLERWLAVADNRGEWERLRRALALEQGFALLIVDVPDVGTEGRVVELLAGEQPSLVALDVRESGEQAPVRELLRRRGERVVVRGVEASRSDIEGLERCLVQLNMRRDQIVERGHVLVIVLRRDAVARMIDVAPDLYSVHRARFRFARLVQPRPAPAWLLTDAEFAAVLDDDGRPLDERLQHYRHFFAAPEPLRWPADEQIAARIFARRECVRCMAWPHPRDLAHALDAPAIEFAEILRDSLRRAQEEGTSELADMCAGALAWVHLQRSDLVEARTVLHAAIVQRPSASGRAWIRRGLLEMKLDAAQGVAEEPLLSFHDDPACFAATWLSVAEYGWELHGTTTRFVDGALDAALDGLPFNRWRLDTSLRRLPSGLIEFSVPEHERVSAIAWLEERQHSSNLDWGAVWTKQLMIERALRHDEREAKLLGLGLGWLDKDSLIYEVWRPLVEIQAERRNTSALERLIRMPLTTDAERRFGPRLAAALHIFADVVERGIVELPDVERENLRARAAARDTLPPTLRLGWWAIELALTSGHEPE